MSRSAADWPRLVIFDLDGTLVDSAIGLCAALNGALSDLGYCTVTPDDVRGWVGTGPAMLIRSALQVQGVAHEPVLPALLERYFFHYGQTYDLGAELFEGVRAGLEALRQTGIAMAVCTNKAQRFIRPILQATGIDSYFPVVVGGDTYAQNKPSPMPLLKLAEQAGIDPAQALMVGDSIHDLRAARAAGMPMFAVTYGYNHGVSVADAGPDGVLASLAQLPPLLAAGRFHPGTSE